MTEYKQFEQFEHALKKLAENPPDRSVRVNSSGDYPDGVFHLAWAVWQAATAQAVPEGFVVVPVEPTEAMLNYGMDHFNGAFIEGGATGIASLEFAYKAMIKAAQENNQ